MGIYKSLYYENLLSIIINFLLFSQSGTSNLAKLLQDWQLFPVVYYENLLSIIIYFLLFSPKQHFTFGKIIARLVAAFPGSLLFDRVSQN